MVSTRPVRSTGAGTGPKIPGPNGNGSKRHEGFPEPESNWNRYRIGMWVGLASVTMMFTSLTSAYIVRSGSSNNDWTTLPMPTILLASTALIIGSSATLEIARRKLKAALSEPYTKWLALTVVLGLGFLVAQIFAWRQLAQKGIYVATNPHSSFFYLLTGAHAIHLVGGLLGLIFLWLRSRRHVIEKTLIARRKAATDAVSIYWHFMDGLWIYLFLLLFLWR